MAASKNYRFLPTEQKLTKDSMIFELDESDIWNTAARSASPEFRKASSRISRKPSKAARGVAVTEPASLPVNIPDWSKILKEEYRENHRRDVNEDDFSDDGEDSEDRVPPHEFLARQMARTRIASFSLHEGIGRTLKGRDLSRVRNAIWEKIGFED
ncbi:uncharacterized protein LOC111403552 [Olea europaea var. sylvestris]|uniref:Senescence regulator n=1 Tax=Olea europaea subsp. europaea TaxID=158383 RepID=A0A8S0RD89_OLEEU|nr:uncharacterized protein LOC111403552 [Olea europaea var. sylvestris]CAA2976804.1 Hypothetical predicted protein [Olea europaea subsp. europaea]